MSREPSEPAPRRSRRARSATSPRSAFVTTSTSGTSMIPAFRNWSMSPDAGLHHHRDGVAHLLHVRLRLADAHRLDHDHVERRRERLGGLARGGGQAAEAPAGGGRADQDAVVAWVVLDPRAVAQQRAAGALRGRVHRQHRHASGRLAPLAHERGQQRRLARAGRPGQPDQVRGAPRRRARRGRPRRAARPPARAAAATVLDQVERRRSGRTVALAQARPSSAGLRRRGPRGPDPSSGWRRQHARRRDRRCRP